MRRFRPRLPPALALLAILVALLWYWPNRQVPAAHLPSGKLQSLSYAPFRRFQSPLAHRYASAAEVAADLRRIARVADGIRSYASAEGGYDLPALAHAAGLHLWLGIWLGSNPARNAAEMAAGIAQARAWPGTVTRVIVGNEVLLRRDLPVAALIADIDHVRAAVAQQVSYADVPSLWEKFPSVAAHVDVVTVHLLPYWEDHPTGIADAVAASDALYRRMQALFPGKSIAIGETGWPSRGRERGPAVPSRVNEAIFLDRFARLARADRFDYNIIEAFDQDWKYQNEGVVGANWGLFTAGRRAKFPAHGPVGETPDWPVGAAGSVLAGLLLYGLARQAAAPRGVWQESLLALAAMTLGAALGAAAFATAPVLYDPPSRIAGVGNVALQAAFAVLLARRAARRIAGAEAPPGRTGAEATRALQRLLRGRADALARDEAGWCDDFGFVFLWTAALLALLLVLDPRYRDFPLPTFAVPLAGVLLRALLRDLPRGGGGREEAVAGAALTLAAVAGAWQEGAANLQSLGWTAMALLLAAPAVLRLRPARPPPLRRTP